MDESRATSESVYARYLPSPGDVIAGKYVVQEIVGKGGMGVVIAARHMQLKQTVAIKLLSTRDANPGDANQRLLREAELAAQLRSEHVVRVHDVGMLDGGAPFLVMEYLVGKDVKRLLDERGSLPVSEAVDFVLQACDAVSEAHAAGIVHRDLKPSNLFVTRRRDGRQMIKVLDFGISKLLPKDPSLAGSLTATRSVLGSPHYMSPEQVRDARQVDGRCDIWSLGVILHELLTGQPAFAGETLPSVCAAIIADEPSPICAARPDVPAEIERIVIRCLQKKPENRYQSVDLLMDALRPFAPSERISLLADTLTRSSSNLPVSSSDGRVVIPVRRVGELEMAATQASISNHCTTAKGTRPSPRRYLVVVGAVLAMMMVFGAVWGVSRRAQQRRALASSVSRGQTLPSRPVSSGLAPSEKSLSAASAAPGGRAVPAPSSFVLRLESVPSASEILQGADVLGVTPLDFLLETRVVAAKPVELTLRKEGYEPFVVVQGASRNDVVLRVALVPHPATHPAAPARPGERAQHRRVAPGTPRGQERTDARGTASANPAASLPGDIRSTR